MEPIPNTSGDVHWANDNNTLFYVVKDPLDRCAGGAGCLDLYGREGRTGAGVPKRGRGAPGSKCVHQCGRGERKLGRRTGSCRGMCDGMRCADGPCPHARPAQASRMHAALRVAALKSHARAQAVQGVPPRDWHARRVRRRRVRGGGPELLRGPVRLALGEGHLHQLRWGLCQILWTQGGGQAREASARHVEARWWAGAWSRAGDSARTGDEGCPLVEEGAMRPGPLCARGVRAGSAITSETRFILADRPQDDFKVVLPRCAPAAAGRPQHSCACRGCSRPARTPRARRARRAALRCLRCRAFRARGREQAGLMTSAWAGTGCGCNVFVPSRLQVQDGEARVAPASRHAGCRTSSTAWCTGATTFSSRTGTRSGPTASCVWRQSQTPRSSR